MSQRIIDYHDHSCRFTMTGVEGWKTKSELLDSVSSWCDAELERHSKKVMSDLDLARMTNERQVRELRENGVEI